MVGGPTAQPRGRVRARWRVLPLLVAAVLAGCGSGTGSGGGGDSAAVLAAWQAFPAGADPRPLVLTGPSSLDPQHGFPPGDAKTAYLDGRFDLAATLPAGPGTAGGYPVISARAAFDRLSSAADPAKTGTSYRLRVVSASLGSARFDTDRGPRRLPAWRFGLAKVADPVWVLAVRPTVLWTAKPVPGPDLGFSATSTSDERSLDLHFIGGPDEPTGCGIAYTASAVESSTAVVIALHQEPRVKVDGMVACNSMGYPRTVPLRLATALGGRVLLTAYGVPMTVSTG